MKKKIALIMALALSVTTVFAGCGAKDDQKQRVGVVRRRHLRLGLIRIFRRWDSLEMTENTPDSIWIWQRKLQTGSI